MTPAELPEITLREIRTADAELLAALQSEMDDDADDRDDDGAGVSDTARMHDVLIEMTKYPEFRAYLACDRDGTPVGTFSLMVFCSPSHQGTWQALLDAVVVKRAHRGRGVGEAMLRHALKLAADAGCYKLSLSSNLKRMDAHRFYERLGFTRHGISFSIPLTANA